MSELGSIPAVARPAFFPGQLLTAADLAAGAAYDRELRRLHNRALHDWGVVAGFGVTGVRGSGTVTVTPGLALDCDGREIILASSVELPLRSGPGGGGRFFLGARYTDDADLDAESRGGACATAGAIRLRERCTIAWRDPDDDDAAARLRPGVDVILASADVKNCRLARDVSLDVRRIALPATRPSMFAGRTGAGTTEWRWWPGPANRLGVRTTVATNAAGFDDAPVYQVSLMGARQLGNDPIDGPVFVLDPTATSFDLVVVLPQGMIGIRVLNPPAVVAADNFLDRARTELHWHVAWVGVGA